MAKNVLLLDATLRDGGQGLEDLFSSGVSDKIFTDQRKRETIKKLEDAYVDIIEIGAIGPSKCDKTQFSIYQNVQDLSKFLPTERKYGTMYVGLYIGPDTDVNDIPDWNPSLVEGLRVVLRYSELKKSLDYCAALVKKGYKVFVQPMLTMRYKEEELEFVINSSNDMGAYACYFVDSYGYMEHKDVERLFNYYDARLDKDIKVGFHAHNNMNLAYSNVQCFINFNTRRDLIVDSCVTGMGQGAGNMPTELLVPYLNEHFEKQYDFERVLEVCEYLDNEMTNSNLWGYSVTRLLPALYKTAYKYAFMMRNQKHLSFVEINTILRDMPDELRNRYTPQSLVEILKIIGK